MELELELEPGLAELVQLKAAVDRHGRDWVSVSRDFGSRTRQQCKRKVIFEVGAGRMQEPGAGSHRAASSGDAAVGQ